MPLSDPEIWSIVSIHFAIDFIWSKSMISSFFAIVMPLVNLDTIHMQQLCKHLCLPGVPVWVLMVLGLQELEILLAKSSAAYTFFRRIIFGHFCQNFSFCRSFVRNILTFITDLCIQILWENLLFWYIMIFVYKTRDGAFELRLLVYGLLLSNFVFNFWIIGRFVCHWEICQVLHRLSDFVVA